MPRLVYLSFLGAAPDATFTLARDHWATEEHIRATGLRWTFLRMNLYMDFIPNMVGADGVIRGPAGDGRVSAILRDDVAAAAAAVLRSDGHDGVTYDLTGPSSFSLAEAAALMGARFEDETDEQAYASRAGYGAPGLGGPRVGHVLPGHPRRQPRRHQPGRARADRPRRSLAEYLRARSRGPRGALARARAPRASRQAA